MSEALLESIAKIIRHPAETAGSDRLSFLGLNQQEYSTILKLKADEELNKYGGEQADQRWEGVYDKLSFLFTFVDFDTVSNFWFEHFEPERLRSGIDQNGEWYYTSRFLEFLLADLRSETRKLDDQRSWLGDLVAFEQAMFLLERPILKTRRPEDSRFKLHYKILNLNHDIPQAIDLAKNEEDQKSTSKIEPQARKTNLLFIRNKDGNSEIYQIKKADCDFFGSQTNIMSDEKVSELEKIGML